MTSDEEAAYVQGSRRAWLTMLSTCLRELGYDSAEVKGVAWVTEREEAVLHLKSLCLEFGDVEWDESLHLADVIDKHLGDHLRRTGRLMKKKGGG